MKKLLVGCLVVLVLGAVVLAVGGYLLYRAASPMIDNARSYLEGLSELGELDSRITNRASYTPPDSGELSETQMQRFVRVQDSVRAALGRRMTEIDEKYKHLKGGSDATREPTITEMIGAIRDIGGTFVEARRFQVDALNQEKFSQAEYSWVRDRVFQAAGLEVARTIDLKKIGDAVRENTGLDDVRAPELPKIDVPEKNRALVKPYLDRMDQWIPLAFFGL